MTAGWGQQVITGTVVSAKDGLPLPGANVKLIPANLISRTDRDGTFSIVTTGDAEALEVSFIGYERKILRLDSLQSRAVLVRLQELSLNMQEVVVSTGYQDLPAERTTGSFALLTKEQLNRRVSPDILSRIEDLAPGVIFNRGSSSSGDDDISIRGRSTLFANAKPLVVIDNFPYDGDLGSINPNDVESISILKDAAAASIWGARAGNGVIVVTTRKGEFNQKPQWSFNSNVTVGARPDLFELPQMSVSDYINTEVALFQKGFYQSSENSLSRPALSPVVELLIARRDGIISDNELSASLNTLKSFDVRQDLSRLYYQPSLNQQYSAAVQGGNNLQRYNFSVGLDRQRASYVGNGNRRLTANFRNQMFFLNKKLSWDASVYYVNGQQTNNNPGPITWSAGQPVYPYARLADEQGNSMAVTKDIRNTFLDVASNEGLLEWSYRPLDELNTRDNRTNLNDLRWNTGLRYQFSNAWSASAMYQFGMISQHTNDLRTEQSFEARDLINQFTQVMPDGSLVRNLPIGGILDRDVVRQSAHSLRGQLNYENVVGGKHDVKALAGYEVKDLHNQSALTRTYGYNTEYSTGVRVDYVSNFSRYISPASTRTIPFVDSEKDRTDRFISWFGNAGYTYDRRYTVTASARIDKSNLFGVSANQRALPLWSAGLRWNVDQEKFFPFKQQLSYLRFRATYGFNGNIDKGVTAFTTALFNSGTTSQTRLPYAQITNPPNPDLRWEKVKVWNLALDIAGKNNRLSGTVEFYGKRGQDLIGSLSMPATSGITQFRGNSSGTKTSGADIQITAKIIDAGKLRLQSTWWGSIVKERVTDYEVFAPLRSYLQWGDGIQSGNLPFVGRPLYAVYSLPWAGLDPVNGDPRSYLNGEVSSNFNGIMANVTFDDLIYHGSARPTFFGVWRNELSWNRLSVSANISYRAGYYYRRKSIMYGNNMGLGRHGDFAKRWQKPGDEQFTDVPSVPAVANNNRDFIYQFSEALVEKGDHIRLQDVQLSHDITKRHLRKMPFESVGVYVYANNLGLLWKASDAPHDPDYLNGRLPKTFAAGIKLTL